MLDSYDNKTYFDGQCAAIYKQWPPLVNACRKPGEWQTYDIVFESPRFDENGKAAQAGICDGVPKRHRRAKPFRDHRNTSAWDQTPAYTAHPDRQPIRLQFHGNPVRYRNIWVREIQPMVPKNG